MPLFRDIDHFCEHYPALASVDWDRLLPSVEIVEIITLRNVVLGPTLFDALQAAFTASLATPTPTPMITKWADLYAKVMKPLAFLSAYEAIPDLAALFTSSGLYTTTTEGQERAPMWLSNQTRDSAFDKGHVWLGELIGFLWANKSTYTEWVGAPVQLEVSESLITTVTTIDRHTRILGSAWLLHMLRPSMRSFQDGILATTLGASTLSDLLSKVQAGTGLSPEEAVLVDHARAAILYGALAEEIVPLRLKVDRSGVWGYEAPTGGRESSRIEKQAHPDQVTSLVRSCRAKSDAFLEKITAIVAPTKLPEPGLGETGSVFRS